MEDIKEDNEQRKIEFIDDDGDTVSLFVVEQATVVGINYLLVTDSEEDEADAYIMKEIEDTEGQSTYEMVSDDHELSAVSKIFVELLDDVDIEMQ